MCLKCGWAKMMTKNTRAMTDCLLWRDRWGWDNTKKQKIRRSFLFQILTVDLAGLFKWVEFFNGGL